ncbi:hypothetical protein J3R83DRAFT_6981 [Lanmaoa asiatica]|nr:hypothetical protein J3R83DRAFT_6981 [Lanmaoa asiatica]
MSDDFFSNLSRRRIVPNTHDDFAHAISLRFGSADLRTPRLLPPENHTPPPSNNPPRPSNPHSFPSIPPSSLPPYLADPRTLILDIRPHAAHAAARINHALSLSVPTTLLKRPLFSLSKLSQMLPSPSSRARFADWSSASRILVYDSDSAASPDNSIIAGLLRKFHAEGFTGELAWVHGGFQAVWREAPDLATTEPLTPEEDDPDPSSSSGTLRTTHLPKAAFSLFSTTAAPPPQLSPIPGSHALPNTPAPRAANPFFDTIRQNIELSHGITERISLRIPRRVRRRIHDLPFRWLQEIARRSATRHSSASRHPAHESLESGSESGDDPHTSDPDDNDPNVEEGTEVLAMQFYRIELAEQRRLRSIMEHHTRESQATGSASFAKPRRIIDKGGPTNGANRSPGGFGVQASAKSVPGTPHPVAFPFSITAGVEKGTKNRYTHIWPFEHARVRLHDARHQGSHRHKAKTSERGRSTRDRSGGKSKEKEVQGQEQDKQRRSRSSPAFGKSQDQEVISTSSRYSFYCDARSSTRFEAGLALPTSSSSPSVPRVKIEYDVTEQDSWMSGPSTPATALPLPTPPFYTPMEISPAPTPMRVRPLQLLSLPSGIGVSPGGRLGGTQFTLPLPPSPMRLPNRPGELLPSIGEQTWTSESLFPSAAPADAFTSRAGTVGEAPNDTGTKRDPPAEPSPVDDYVNASYVQPLGTRKRYIATQGPLPSTYVDFWTLVWEQNVHVIVMLTREVENAMVKCGSYWTDTEYGPLRLELLSTSPPTSPSAKPSSTDTSKQGFFAIREPQGETSGASRFQPALITRTFAFSHTSYPGVPPRRITHLQYLDWSDMNVPDDPRGVLDLVKKVEQAVAESTPGPSPSGSMSPGSRSGSLSGSQSPDIGYDQRGYDTSLLSPTSARVVLGGGHGRRRSEWRHPELDPKTGIAAFALGKAAPVLLHCSAGVGRTGGFIAVDAVLDGIRRELRRNREERRLKRFSRVCTSGANDVEASREFSVESTETGFNTVESSGEESNPDENEHMDVDEPTIHKAEKTRDQLHMMNTAPVHVSAGDRTKGRKRHYPGKNPSGEKPCSSSESLVVHVPLAGTDDVPEADIDLGDPKEAGWQSSSTREWVEQVSDETHDHREDDVLPLPPSLPLSRERSPGSTSNSSGPSALHSVDGSVNGSTSADASGSVSASGSGNRAERKSDTGNVNGSGIDIGNGGPPPSSVSKPGSGSISLSNSGSGTGTGSRFGSDLLRVRLRDSSVTSISAESMDSPLPEHERKSNALLHPATHTGSSTDMEIDYPPRPVSVPLQPAHSSTAGLRRAVHSRHRKPMSMIGSSPVASFSSPILPPATAERSISFFAGDAVEGSVSRPSSDLGYDEPASPPQEFESAESADAEGHGKNNQVLFDESEELAVPTKPGNHLRLDTELSSLKVPEISHSSGFAKNPPLPSRETKGKERPAIPLVPRVLDDLELQQSPAAAGVLGASEHDQLAADHPVIDYKLPRELHNDLLPPLISSFAEPICMVIQDMREQRMSLCQSLRQYVFVHAAIIEGALRIVDEERELWGYSGTSDDASSAEGESGASGRKGGRRSGHSEAKAWFGDLNDAEVVVTTPELEHDNLPHSTRPLPIPQPSNHRGSEGYGHVPFAPTSSSSGVSSPSKGKRGPSPTELLREDKTGALSLNKRPIIHRSNEGDQFSFEWSKSSPAADENGGGSRDAVVGVSARSAPGRLANEQSSNRVAICGYQHACD